MQHAERIDFPRGAGSEVSLAIQGNRVPTPLRAAWVFPVLKVTHRLTLAGRIPCRAGSRAVVALSLVENSSNFHWENPKACASERRQFTVGCFPPASRRSPKGRSSDYHVQLFVIEVLERAKGFEPSTSTLARLCSPSQPSSSQPNARFAVAENSFFSKPNFLYQLTAPLHHKCVGAKLDRRFKNDRRRTEI